MSSFDEPLFTQSPEMNKVRVVEYNDEFPIKEENEDEEDIEI